MKVNRWMSYFIALSVFSSAALAYSYIVNAQSTDRCANSYWVGGSGSFSQASHWSSSSGVATGNCRVPASGDVIYFDAHSGSGTVTQDLPNLVTGPLSVVGSSITIRIANGTTWRIVPSFSQTDPGLPILAQATNVMWILFFFAACGIIIFAAWKAREHMGGS